jgi:hypothetical protein
VAEVESGESVNNLEAMAQWVHFSRVRAPFHLYVPVTAFDVARRLCEANHVRVSEIWTYRPLIEGFDLVRAFHDSSAGGAPAAPAASKKPRPSPARKPAGKPARRPAAKAPKKAAKAARPKARKPAPKARKTR